MVDNHMRNVHMQTFFYPNACNVCQLFGENIHLLRCTGCRMIVYCCEEHQKEHWPVHKQICEVLSTLTRAFHIYGNRENMENKADWLVAKINLLEVVQSALDRNLTDAEFEMLHSPRSCEICHETRHKQLTNCNVCPYASFCLKHPKDSRHTDKCKTSLLALEAICLNYCPDNYFECDNYGKGVPKDMKEAIARYESTYRFDKLFKLKSFWDIILSQQISQVYTFLFTLEKLSLPESPKMTVHVIGANLMEMISAYYWRCVLHHLEYLEDLHVVCIGPEIKNDCHIMNPMLDYNVGQRKLSFQFVGSNYAIFVNSLAWTTPDCILGFNVAIYRCPEKENTWELSLRCVADLGCPFSFTSTCELESDFDKEKINSFFRKKVEPLWSGKNPFSSWQPLRNVILGSFFYHNQYLTIYKRLC